MREFAAIEEHSLAVVVITFSKIESENSERCEISGEIAAHSMCCCCCLSCS